MLSPRPSDPLVRDVLIDDPALRERGEMRSSAARLTTLLWVGVVGWLASTDPLAAQVRSGRPPCDASVGPRVVTQCLTDQLIFERTELDATLDHYRETLGRDEARSLDRAQDDWERFVEDDCESAARRFGDAGLEAVALLSCLVEETSRRRFQVALLFGARTRVGFDRSAPCFVPDSELVEVVGWVGERQYAGPLPVVPGSEPPDRAAPVEQQVLVLNLDLPLCLDYGEGPVQVTAVQMVARGRSESRGLARYIGQHVEVVGRLFLASGGQDRTPILIMVAEVVPFG